MSHQAEASSVRIMRANGAIVGSGFLVAEGVVLTCAHVVAATLGINTHALAKPEEPLSLDFPLVAPGRTCKAHVTFWEPIQANGGGDIAVLQLDDAPPEGVHLARLVVAEDLWEHRFRAFGFPARNDDGVWASGRLLGRQATDWVQIEDVKETGYRVQQGFSGGAVWDEQLDGVAGMVVAEDGDPGLKTAYMIPTNVLIKAWPPLGQQAIPVCPYRGLFAFREQDARYFFGRETFTQQLVEAVQKKPLLAVIGPSGSGKSSVVFAGLVPQLHREGNWQTVSFRPGKRPFRSLAATLIPLLEPQMSETDRLTEISKLAKRLQEDTLGLEDVLESITEKYSGMHLLLIADQFEELYTLCRESEIRQSFLDALLAGVDIQVQAGRTTVHLVLTLRADFVGQALSYRPFADALQYADLKLGPMNRSELEDAIRKPAQKCKVKIEGGLTERILSEVSQESGHLPLLEFALTLLWNRQHNSILTHPAYEEIGGVEKALADHAEEVYAGLNEAEQRQAQRIFVQLVRPGEGTEDTRRLATRADIGEENWELVVRLSGARLVVSGREETTNEETVEIVHEALISGWQRLRKWMEDNREFRTWQERLRGALRQWEGKGRDDGALLRGALLVEASMWLSQRLEAISAQERAFVETSQQHQAEEEHYLHKLLEEAEQHRQEAERQREKAEQQRQIAVARGLSTQAELLQNQWGHMLERRVLLAIEAMQQFPCLEADNALRNGMALLRRRLASLAHDDSVYAVAFSPDGHLLATASEDKTAGVWEVATGRRLASLAHDSLVCAVAFSPDGRLLATASGDVQSRNGAIGVWEVDAGRRLASLAHDSLVCAVAFSPDGRLLATASEDKTAGVWGVATGRRLASLAHDSLVYAVAFSPDGRLLATASEDKTAGVWEVATGRLLASLAHDDSVNAVAFSPDGRLLATASDDDTAGVWEVATGRRLASLAHGGRVNEVAFSPDGHLLATAGYDDTAGVWEVATGRRLASLTHTNLVNEVAFSPDGHLLATASADKTARLWLLCPEDLIAEAQSRLTRNLTSGEWKQYMGDEPYRKTCPNLP